MNTDSLLWNVAACMLLATAFGLFLSALLGRYRRRIGYALWLVGAVCALQAWSIDQLQTRPRVGERVRYSVPCEATQRRRDLSEAEKAVLCAWNKPDGFVITDNGSK